MDAESRPRLLPAAVLLQRSPGELQIGLDPGWRMAAPPQWHSLLRRLDGRRSWAEISTECRSTDLAALAHLLEVLAAAGLADSDPDSDPTAATPPCVRVAGVGWLGTAISRRLQDSGVELLDATAPAAHRVDLTLLVADTLEADRGAATDLLRHDTVHLPVRAGPTRAVVGPLVVPGRTACVHCTDLTRRDADPAWPTLLSQLQRRPTEASPPALADWTVAITVTQVLGWLAGARPETLGATLEITTVAYETTWRHWPAHPECGCRWLEPR